MIAADDRRRLLQIARQAVAAKVEGRSFAVTNERDTLTRPAGAFVTLTEGEELRGCIGYPEPSEALARVVAHCAAAAAVSDPRFPPVQPDEVARLHVEISVLGPIMPVADPREIVVGRDGLIVEQGFRRGLLLPQVATDWGWDRETFLSQTCVKAGLDSDAWRRGAKIFRFEAEVFGELTLQGPGH
jgi:AmmeMemoRadiSam system protein A